MNLSIREAAALLGRSPRTLRGQLQRGELRGEKHGKSWVLKLEDLPLTTAQRRSMQSRAEEFRRTADHFLPSRASATRDRRRRSIVDLDAFRRGRELLRELQGQVARLDSSHREARATALLEAALFDLATVGHEFDPERKTAALRQARDRLSRAVGHLLLAASSPAGTDFAGDHAPLEHHHGAWVHSLEQHLLPLVGGLLRHAEGRAVRPQSFGRRQ